MAGRLPRPSAATVASRVDQIAVDVDGREGDLVRGPYLLLGPAALHRLLGLSDPKEGMSRENGGARNGMRSPFPWRRPGSTGDA